MTCASHLRFTSRPVRRPDSVALSSARSAVSRTPSNLGPGRYARAHPGPVPVSEGLDSVAFPGLAVPLPPANCRAGQKDEPSACTPSAFFCGLPPAPARELAAWGKEENVREGRGKNHSTQDSHVVPHHGTNWAALRLTAQIGRDAVLSESCGRGYWCPSPGLLCTSHSPPSHRTASASNSRNACPKVTGKQRKRRSPILERGRTNL